MRRWLALVLASLSLAPAAVPAEAAPPPPAPAEEPPSIIEDDCDKESLLTAIARSRAYLTATPRRSLQVAGHTVTPELLRRGLDAFETLVRESWGQPDFDAAVHEAFEWVPMPGVDGQGVVHVTGYHLPMLEAREKPDRIFRHPLYAPPADMLPLDLGAFRPSLAGQTAMARLKGGRIVPYFTRREIDEGKALAGKGLEIAWVADERARNALMIQGSGLLRFADGRVVNANYAGQNGHPFVAGGANPSYVFFKLAPEGPFGRDGVPLTPGRAIATDKRLFATGALAWLSYPRVRLDARGAVAGWEPGGRFVLDQDAGGAITGPGRVDLYFGGGDEAARRAATLSGQARVWFLLPRERE